jgi:hypothetical protein
MNVAYDLEFDLDGFLIALEKARKADKDHNPHSGSSSTSTPTPRPIATSSSAERSPTRRD